MWLRSANRTASRNIWWALAEYVRANPKAVVDTEVFQVWSLGVAPYADLKLKRNFRHTSFFIGASTRSAINAGLADYTPVHLSRVPALFGRDLADFDVALVQVSPSTAYGTTSKAAEGFWKALESDLDQAWQVSGARLVQRARRAGSGC